MTEINDAIPANYARVTRKLRSPRKFRPEFLPIVFEYLPRHGVASNDVLMKLLFHPSFSTTDTAVQFGNVNAYHTDPSTCERVRPYVDTRNPWDVVKSVFISYPKIIRVHDGMTAYYKVVPAHVSSSRELEEFLPPPPGKRYLYTVRHRSAMYRGIDKFEISTQKLDNIKTSLDVFPTVNDQSVIVFVTNRSPTDKYIALDFRTVYRSDTLDPRVLSLRSQTSRSGAAMHTVVVPCEEPQPDQVLAGFSELQIGRHFVRTNGLTFGEHPIEHIIHVETHAADTWKVLQDEATMSMRRCCHDVKEHLRKEVALVTSSRSVAQNEIESSFYEYLKSVRAQNDSTRFVLDIDPDTGVVTLDVFWPRSASIPHFNASIGVFWTPAMFRISTKDVLREFETHVFSKIPSTSKQQDMASNITLGIPDIAANWTTFVHVPPPSDPRAYHAAATIVNGMDTLYPFQKETVCEMVARETAADGWMGLFNTRLTGAANGPGVFQISEPFTPKVGSRKSFFNMNNRSSPVLRRCGGILADEPGMGKTRQIAALIRAVPTSQATLVVVKPNIIAQWKQELDAVWPECRVVCYHGPAKKRIDVGHAVRSHDIVLTTYSTCMSSEVLLDESLWGRIVTDESHDMSPRFSKTFSGFAGPMWCVTATPHKKLRCIMTWLIGNAKKAVAGNVSFNWDVWNFKTFGTPVLQMCMLRKTRDFHLDLPPIVTKNITVILDDDEKHVYNKMKETTAAMMHHISRIALIHRLNMLSMVASFGLFKTKDIQGLFTENNSIHFRDGDPGTPPEEDVCSICIDTFAEPCMTVCLHWFCTECLQLHLSRSDSKSCPMCRRQITQGSVVKRKREEQDLHIDQTGQAGSKMSAMLEDIERIFQTPGRKIIVFFSSATTISWFQEMVEQRLNMTPLTVHGGVALNKRQQNFRRFQTVPQDRLLLASIKTVSDGITLTAASDIMLVTPTGNNALDEQVVGRANRIGRDVNVPVTLWRYIAADTVEEVMAQQQARYGCFHPSTAFQTVETPTV